MSDWVSPGGDVPPDPPPQHASQAYPSAGLPAPAAGPAWGWGPPRPPDIKPGVVPLRPLGLSEILDGAIAIVRAHPRATLGLAAAVTFASQLLQLVLVGGLMRNAQNDLSAVEELDDIGQALGDSLFAVAGAGIIDLAASLVLTGMFTAIVGKAVLGQPVELRSEWPTVRSRLPALLGLTLLSLLLVLLAFVVPMLPGIAVLLLGQTGIGAVLTFLGAVGGTVLAVYVYVSFALATPALVLERQRIVAALRRSRLLVARSFWRVFGILLLAFLITYLLTQFLVLPFAVGGGFLSGGFDLESANELSLTEQLLTSFGAVIAGTIVSPFAAGVTALLYVDRRMRAEGLDVALQQSVRDAAMQ